MADKVIPLSQSYPGGHGDPFDKVVLREPAFPEYREFGEVYELQQGPEGAPIVVTYQETLNAYLERICVSPGIENLSPLNLADSKAVFKGVSSFFLEADRSSKKPTNSSSDSGSTPEASSE